MTEIIWVFLVALFTWILTPVIAGFVAEAKGRKPIPWAVSYLGACLVVPLSFVFIGFPRLEAFLLAELLFNALMLTLAYSVRPLK